MDKNNWILMTNFIGGTMWLVWLGMSYGLIIPSLIGLGILVLVQMFFTKVSIDIGEKGMEIPKSLLYMLRILELAIIVTAISGNLVYWQMLVGYYIIMGVYMGYARPDLTGLSK